MANETGWKQGSQVTLEESGASTADAAFTQANDANLTVAHQQISSGIQYTHGLFILSTVDTTVDPTIGGLVNLYAAPQAIEGAGNANPPNANYPHTFVCSFLIDDDQTLTQNIAKIAPLPFPFQECTFWIENRCGQTVAAGWNLRVTPMAFAPGV